MQTLKKEIARILKETCPNVYLENAPDDALAPYLVYSLSESVWLDGFLRITVDIDIWDKSESSKNVDNIAKSLRKLDCTNFISEDIQFRLYFDRVLNSNSESKNWKRNTVIFTIKYLERS